MTAYYMIRLTGVLRGTIWWPSGTEFEKEFDVSFKPNGGPFARQWTGLRDALEYITNDGDFERCAVEWLALFVYRTRPASGLVGHERLIRECVPEIRPCKAIRHLFTDTSE